MTAAPGDRLGTPTSQPGVTIQLPKLSGDEKQATSGDEMVHMANGHGRGDAFLRMNDSAPIIETEYVSANYEERLSGDEDEFHQRDAYNNEADENFTAPEGDGAEEFTENGNVSELGGGDN
jgi:hypothetical protein